MKMKNNNECENKITLSSLWHDFTILSVCTREKKLYLQHSLFRLHGTLSTTSKIHKDFVQAFVCNVTIVPPRGFCSYLIITFFITYFKMNACKHR